MEKIQISQKSLIISIVVFLGFGFAWFKFYQPQKAKIRALKKSFLESEKQIAEASSFVNEGMTMEEALVLLEKEYSRLDSKFPEKEEKALKMLSEFARDLNLEVISIRPTKKENVTTEDQKEVKLESRVLKKILVSMEVTGTYRDLIKYILTLKELLPAYISVEKMQVKKGSDASSILSIQLTINLFLLS